MELKSYQKEVIADLTRYFNVNQEIITETASMVYGVDTEDARQEYIWLQGEEIRFIYKKNRIHFIWLHHAYHISGQTNLSKEETIAILQQLTYVQE